MGMCAREHVVDVSKGDCMCHAVRVAGKSWCVAMTVRALVANAHLVGGSVRIGECCFE